MAGRILIIDDDVTFTKALGRALSLAGHDVTQCTSADEARALLASTDPDVVILDYQLPDADGLALLDELKEAVAGRVYMMATAFPDLSVAVEAMKRGAFDYLAKGGELSECVLRIERGIELSTLRKRVAEASRESSELTLEQGLLGESEPMRAMRARLLALSASSDTTAFLMGETGTGKGVVARAIHAQSARAFEPFVAVDCTTIPATLVESELFGHEKGAFSGATGPKMGRVESAGRGTLFLDEIGELDLQTQVKLLRLLEEREYTRVGSTRSRQLQSRIIAATNRDLARAVEEGRFRADLRYRLEVFVIEVPPLRIRGDDILLLTRHFAAERARALGREMLPLSVELIQALLRYPFPGNVRELRNMVEQAFLLAAGSALTLEEFPVLRRFLRRPSSGGASRPRSSSAPTTLFRSPSDAPNSAPALATGTRRHSSAPVRSAFDSGVTAPISIPPARIPVVPGLSESQRAGPRKIAEIRQIHATKEKEAILAALQETGGNVTAAAKKVGLSRFQFVRRMQKYEIS